MMTRTQQAAYRFLTEAVVLLLLYALLSLLTAVKFLSPDDALLYALPYNQAGGLSNILLHLTILTGLIGGGLYMAAAQRSDNALSNETLVERLWWAWTGLVALSILAAVFGFTSGRHLLELPPLLYAAQAITLALLVFMVGAPRTPLSLIWAVGMALAVVALLAALIPAGDYLADRVLRAVSVGLSFNIAYPLAAVALGFWLMHRFSNITPGWAAQGANTVAGYVVLAGVLLSLPAFYTLGLPEWARGIGGLGLVLIPLLYLLFAAHSYKALSDRNATHTLAAHWFALSLVLFLLGAGLLGAADAPPEANRWTAGTRLTDLRLTLMGLAVVAMILGVTNQAAAELRGHNRRVTGFIPLWLSGFGIIGGALALGGAGLVQVYLERVLSIGYLDTQTLLIPLYAGWTLGLILLLLAVLVYLLTLWLRRPRRTP